MMVTDSTPVLVEWYVHKHIPSTHHVTIVPYKIAKEWLKSYPKLNVKLIDPALYDEMVANRMILRR